MTKKDYELIARHIKAVIGQQAEFDGNYGVSVLVSLARSLATELGEKNPRFDGDRFLVACGVIEI